MVRLCQERIPRFGVPAVIITDRGSERFWYLNDSDQQRTNCSPMGC